MKSVFNFVKDYKSVKTDCYLNVCSNKCGLHIEQSECSSKPKFQKRIETIPYQDYVIIAKGLFINYDETESTPRICFFARSPNEVLNCFRKTDSQEFYISFKFTAKDYHTIIGFNFLNDNNDQELTYKLQLNKFFLLHQQELQTYHDCCTSTDYNLITQEDIGDGGSFIITKPGNYRLTESINFKCNFAIKIECSCVNIDLNTYKILSTYPDGTNYGIWVESPNSNILKNIHIKNGKICKSGSHGILMINSEHSTIENIYVTKCQGTQDADSAFYIIDSNFIYITKCEATYNNNRGYYIVGESENCEITESVSHDNGAGGFYLIGQYHLMKDCLSYKNNTLGILLLSNNSKVSNCVSRENQTFGFFLIGDSLTIENCSSYNNSDGFSVTSFINSNISNCISSFNEGYGFFSNVSQFCTLFKCNSNNNRNGFNSTQTINNNIYDGCIAHTNSEVGFGLNGSNERIINSFSYNNTLNGISLFGDNITVCDTFSGHNLEGGIVSLGDNNQIKSCKTFNNGSVGTNLQGNDATVCDLISSQNNSGIIVGSGKHQIISCKTNKNSEFGTFDNSLNSTFANTFSSDNGATNYFNVSFVPLDNDPAPTYWQNVG
jgi:hypothetical protein